MQVEQVTRQASLRAVKRYREFLDEVPRMWRPAKGNEWSMRFWAIDDDGRITRVPAQALEGFGSRAAKDTTAIAAAVWCGRHKPAAIVFASETWCHSHGPGGYERMVRALGETPDLMNPANRDLLRNRFGATVSERLWVWGEIHGLPATSFQHEIIGETLGPREVIEKMDNRFSGVLTGELVLRDVGKGQRATDQAPTN